MKILKAGLIIGGLAIALLIVIQTRSCINENRTSGLSNREGQFQAYKAQAEKEKEELQKQKSEVEKQVKTLKAAISELEEKTEEYREEIEVKDAELIELKKKFSLLEEEDKDAKILNLQAQVDNLDAQLDKAVAGWNAAEAKALGWKKAFDLKSEYCQKLEAQLDLKENLLNIALEVSASKDRMIRSLKAGKTIERIVTWPLSGYALFKVAQGVLK